MAFNFRKYGNCVRADIEPFKMPRKFTFCFKKFGDYSENFNFINLVGTSHGKSIIEDFDNKTSWRKMKGEHRMINYIMIHMLHWGCFWHTIHETKASSGGLGGVLGNTWFDWEIWCLAANFEDGQMISYVNGVLDGGPINGDQVWMDPLKKANNLSFEEDLITDVLL